ncbi:MAG: DUF1501 domain-containing protein [Alistipes sp.]|nr:DUF1501 domain-containing protein [Alistipes sp.]MBP3496709.1 DUF1501 domain-containing protein [Alistipes sp.]
MRRIYITLTLLLAICFAADAQRAKSVILVYLDGGPAQTDTFDPKPEMGRNYHGSYSGVCKTNVEGIEIGEKLPLLASMADKYTLIRSLTHGSNAHETGHYAMITGDTSGGAVVYPSFGAVISYMKRDSYKGILPSYISVTSANSRFNEGGFLGNEYKSFDTGGKPEAEEYEVEGVVNRSVDRKRMDQRVALLDKFENRPMGKQTLDSLRGVNMEFIWGDTREIFNLSTEPDSVRARYGKSRLGQSCLVARRLVEAGVPFVNVRTTGWDTHKKHFQKMNTMLPDLDRALSALLADLDARGLLDSTIVLCGGEFGRSPKVLWEAPWNGGRAHFGAAFSYLVAGGGFHGGKVVGKSDRTGEKVAERPVSPCDLIGTVYLLMGIDPYGTLPHVSEGELPILPSLLDEKKSNGLLYEIIDIKAPRHEK